MRPLPSGRAVERCPYTYESGSRVRVGKLVSGARLAYTYIYIYFKPESAKSGS